MALFDWKDEYAVNIKAMDLQHMSLVEMINDLYRGLLSNEPEKFLGDHLDRLVEYAGVHFRDEEALMTQNNYPELGSHKQDHEAFVAQVIDYNKQSKAGTLKLSVKMVNFLKDWLKAHIMGKDKRYGAYLNEKGIY